MSRSATVPASQRRDPRQRLMLRTAKVVCQSGEYVCLIRDVSAQGVGLRFFHDVPQEKRIFLELANGALYPIERVWADEGEAGFRFATPIMLGTFVSEAALFPHRAVRMRLQMPVLLTVAGEDCPAMLADISRCGAKFTADRALPEHALARFEAPGLPLRFGHIQWRRDLQHGIAFQEPIGLETLARALHALQPYAVLEDGAASEQAATRAA